MQAFRYLGPLLSVASLTCCQSERPSEEFRSSDSFESCPVEKCLEPPSGIKGLAFGMSEDEVKATLGPLKPKVFPPITPSIGASGEKSSASIRNPAVGYSVKTTFGQLEAFCELHFLVEARLSRMDCRLHGGSNKARAIEVVFARLIRNYGKPHNETKTTASWSRGGATLLLDKQPSDLHRPFFRLENYLLRDAREREALRQQANHKLLKRRRDEKRRQKAEKEALERQLRDGDDRLDRDLSGPPELPSE